MNKGLYNVVDTQDPSDRGMDYQADSYRDAAELWAGYHRRPVHSVEVRPVREHSARVLLKTTYVSGFNLFIQYLGGE